MGALADAREAARFHNALRIMLNISVTDLRDAGVIDGNWGDFGASGHRDQPHDFVESPFREALRMPDGNFERLFALIESRQPEALRGHDSPSAGQAAKEG